MSAYISANFRRQIRSRFSDRCAYCQTPEALTVATFEVEHIIPRSADGKTVWKIFAWHAQVVIVIKRTIKRVSILLPRRSLLYFIPMLKNGKSIFPGAWTVQK